MCRSRLLTSAIFALSLTTGVAFTCPIKSAIRCSTCNTTGVLQFSVSVDESGQKANVTCCPLGGFQTGVYVQRSNRLNVNHNISYFPRDGNCDRLALPLTELHCSFYLVCRSTPIGSNKTEEVRVAVKDVLSFFTNSAPSSAKIDALQYCQCSQIKADVTSSISLISSIPVEKLRQMTTVSNLIITTTSKGYLTSVVAGTIVTLILILTALMTTVIVAAWKKNKKRKPQIVQISRDEQQENKPLIALYRIITSDTPEKLDANSSQVESPPCRVEVQPFVQPIEFEPSNLSQTPVQCTNTNPSSSGIVFYTGGDIIQPTPGSMTSAMTFIPEGTSV